MKLCAKTFDLEWIGGSPAPELWGRESSASPSGAEAAEAATVRLILFSRMIEELLHADQHRLELIVLDRIFHRGVQPERPKLAAHELQSRRLDHEHTQCVGPSRGDVTQQLEARAIRQSLARHQHVKWIGAHQIDARGFAGGDVHFKEARALSPASRIPDRRSELAWLRHFPRVVLRRPSWRPLRHIVCRYAKLSREPGWRNQHYLTVLTGKIRPPT